MSFSDYQAGLRDGFALGFNVGYRKGFEDAGCSGYLTGYRDGYKDASMGLPYRPQERLLENRSFLSQPLHLPKIEPLPLPTYQPPKVDMFTKIDLAPKINPLPKIDPLPDFRPKIDTLRTESFTQFHKSKKPWEF